MVSVTAPGAPVTSIRRMFEAYTLTMASSADNDAVYVDVLDITGRGILTSFGNYMFGGATTITVRITIDSVDVFEAVMMGAGDDKEMELTPFAGFETNCKVSMKGAAAFSARYWASALVE